MTTTLIRQIINKTKLINNFFARSFSISPIIGIKASELSHENIPPNQGCPVCSRGITFTKNDVLFLSQFMTPEGYMISRRNTGVCRKQQRRIFKHIHIARREGMLPRKPPQDGGDPPEYGKNYIKMASRRFFVGGNWKMNCDINKANSILEFLNAGQLNKDTEVVVAPPSIYVSYIKQNLKPENVKVALQNCHTHASGAFTGEVAAEMGADVGCDWVIIGHSERRHVFKETNEFIGEKVKHVLTKTKLGVIACIGELLEERERNETMTVCATQLKAIADNIDDWSRVVIAYEPVWAIGTGKVATPDQAQDVHNEVRKWLETNVNKEVADTTRILYGGSVSASNCVELSKKPDVDGFLVGGASLKPDFVQIVNARQ